MTVTAQPAPQDIDRGFPRIATMGLSGVLVSFADRLSEVANRAALAFRARVEAECWPGVAETAASLTSVLVRFDPLATGYGAVSEQLLVLLEKHDWYAASLPGGRRHWRIPTVFGGTLAPQLVEAAALAGQSPADAVVTLSAHPVRVLTIGFAPGLPYMGTLPEAWDIPRQTQLSARVPASAVVVALRQLIIFPTTTPTGWRHIGQTAFRGFRPEASDPFVLRSGDEVSLVPVTEAALALLKTDGTSNGGATFEVIG